MNTLPKQVVEHNIPFTSEPFEGFVYKWTNLNNKKIYEGSRVGLPLDGYWNSSNNEEFHNDLLAPDAKFRYEVLQYGTKEYVKQLEYQKLTAVNAKDNPMYYNKHNGFPSNFTIPRIGIVKEIANQITTTKKFEGVMPTLTAIDKLPVNKVQIRFFSLISEHVTSLKDIMDDRLNLEHLLVVILENRKYKNIVGDLIIDGNHSIAAAKESKHCQGGLIPTLRIPEHLHKDWTDDEVELIALYLNPREKNPKLQTSLEDLAKRICHLRIQGLDSNSNEIQQLKDDHNLTKKMKQKVSKMANEMYNQSVQTTETNWIDWGTGDEKRALKKIQSKECITLGNNTNTFSKFYSTAKYNAWADIHDILIWNRNNPNNKVLTYRVRWYHPDAEYKKLWINERKEKNEYVIDQTLGLHGIKRDWIYLTETKSNLTTEGGE